MALPRDESKATGFSLVAFLLGTPVSIYNRELYPKKLSGQDIIAKVCNAPAFFTAEKQWRGGTEMRGS
jgi:hypothetical protein